MKFLIFASCALLALFPLHSNSTTPETQGLVAVKVELSGFDEAKNNLKGAMDALSSSLREAAKSPKDLSVEQMKELKSLIETSDELVNSLDRTLKDVKPAIDNVKDPAKAVLTELLTTTRVEAVEPTIESIKETVSFWIVIILVGVAVLLSIIGGVFYLATKQLRQMSQTLKSISNEYEIVRRAELKAPTT